VTEKVGVRESATGRTTRADQHRPLEETTFGDGNAKAGGDATSGERNGGGREKSKGGRERSREEGDLEAATGDGGT